MQNVECKMQNDGLCDRIRDNKDFRESKEFKDSVCTVNILKLLNLPKLPLFLNFEC